MPPQFELKQKILQKYNFLFQYHNVGAKAQPDSVRLGIKKRPPQRDDPSPAKIFFAGLNEKKAVYFLL